MKWARTGLCCLLVLWLMLPLCSAEQVTSEGETILLIDQGISFELPEGFALTDSSRAGRWVYENVQKGVTVDVDLVEEDLKSQKTIIEKVRQENIAEELTVNENRFLVYRSEIYRNGCHVLLLNGEGFSLQIWCFYPIGTELNEIPSEVLQIIQSCKKVALAPAQSPQEIVWEQYNVAFVLPEGFGEPVLISAGMPDRYESVNPHTGISLIVDCARVGEKDQKLLLRKLHDTGNRYITSDMIVGDYHYLVYYNELRSNGWGAILMTQDGNGYSHAFYCGYPDGQSLTQTPNELYTLLSSFRLLDQNNKITQ